MNMEIIKETRKKVCANECRNLAAWLTDRAKLIENGITDDQNTLAILDRYVGRIKARIDEAGWTVGFEEESHEAALKQK